MLKHKGSKMLEPSGSIEDFKYTIRLFDIKNVLEKKKKWQNIN